jgi:hypothetical protein
MILLNFMHSKKKHGSLFYRLKKIIFIFFSFLNQKKSSITTKHFWQHWEAGLVSIKGQV